MAPAAYAASRGLGVETGTAVGDGAVAGLPQRAASERRAVVVYELDPTGPFETRLAAAGVASAAAAPLRVGGDLLGILSVGAPAPRRSTSRTPPSSSWSPTASRSRSTGPGC